LNKLLSEPFRTTAGETDKAFRRTLTIFTVPLPRWLLFTVVRRCAFDFW